MHNIFYFFRSNTSNHNFINFGIIHLSLLAFALFISAYIYKMKSRSRKLELFIGIVLLVQQITLYCWYTLSDFNILQEGLPLFHCRIAIITISIGMILNKKFPMKLGACWGIFTAPAALLFPGLDPFSFPHVTQFSYFIGHILLLWGSVYILFAKKINVSKKDIKNILIFTNVYHVLMFILDTMIKANYGYMLTPPIKIGLTLNHMVYALVVISIFNIVLILEYFILFNKENNSFLRSYDEDDSLSIG